MGKELQQTKTKFKLVGKVEGIDRDNAYTEKVAEKGKHKGENQRSLGFQVKTSETNKIRVSMFSYEPKQVFLWNSEKKKKAQEQNKEYKGDWVDFDKWLSKKEQYREKGYAVLQSRVGLTYGEDGKIESQGLPTYVAIEEIYNNLNNGDSVVIEGNISYNSYQDREGKTKESKNFNIERIFKIKDVDFEDENFEEVTYFEQEIVFVDAMHEPKENKVYVTGRHINYNKTFHDTEFVIDYSDGNGGRDADMVKLSEAFVKKMKFGDLINVFGDVLNRVVIVESSEAQEEALTEEERMLASLGGRSKPSYAPSNNTIKNYISESQIFGVDKWKKKEYKEEDFEIEDDSEDANPLQDELGGKSKESKKNNPFDIDDDSIEITEDDLPF